MAVVTQPGIMELPGLTDTADLCEDEKRALFEAALRSGNMPRRGRPKKGGNQVRWSDFGLTRQRIHEWRRLAEIPDDEFNAYIRECREKGKHTTRRGILVRFGKINVLTADIYENTPTGELAEMCLRRVEQIFGEMHRRERRAFLHALRWRLRCIAQADHKSEE